MISPLINLWATCGQPNWVRWVVLGGSKPLNKQMLKSQDLDYTFIPHQRFKADVGISAFAFFIVGNMWVIGFLKAILLDFL